MKRLLKALLLFVTAVGGLVGNAFADPALSVDFGCDIGPLRRELHSSGFGPSICSCPTQHVATIREMGFKAARTHDWALINPGQRVCDYFFIFPLMHLDATDPKNYVFGPTDYLLKRTREEAGLDVLYRLGTSIEHSGNTPHFNAAIPTDFDKVAEIFAGTVRHYNCSWADGYRWGIRYWEIWNEPDGLLNMWCPPEGDEVPSGDKVEQAKRDKMRRDLFIKFYVTCLKRLKGEFGDTIKVGGPALCYVDEAYVRPLFAACKAAGVAPDFFSWHHYCEYPATIDRAIDRARALCDEYGFTKCELIIDEWHYFSRKDYDWDKLGSQDPEVVRKVWSGPRGHNGIDASCFALAVLSRFQTSKLDQAYYYGCRSTGAWGYMDEFKNKFKVYYGLKLFGEVVRNYTRLCAATDFDSDNGGRVTVLAVKSADSRRRALLITDYRTRAAALTVDVKGVPSDAKVTARVHDYTHDFASADFAFADGKLTLRKTDRESAAYLVEFACGDCEE